MLENKNNLSVKHISIVIVNYKTAELVMQSVLSLSAQRSSTLPFTVYVVDNASLDGSDSKAADFIDENGFGDWVKLLVMPVNGGFAYGSNAGIRPALAEQSDYIMLLNPDTIVRDGAIQALADFLDSNPQAGIVGSQLENIDGHVENSAHRFHSALGELVETARLGVLSRLLESHEITLPIQHQPHVCDWVSGSSMMVRKQVFEKVGLLDEVYFLYFEEVDFFFRAKQAGWQTWYVPASRVMHMEGAATGIKLTKRRPAYWYASRRRYFIKHHGVLGLVFADFMWTVGRLSYLVRRMLRLGAQKPANDPKWLMYDLLTGDILSILSGQAWRLKQEKIR